MTDRPILFSGPMIRALMEGRKTQTRRLATSTHFRKVVLWDRLWVRETHRKAVAPDCKLPNGYAYRYDGRAMKSRALAPGTPWKPAIHMPREASRITLLVEGARKEPLQWLTNADAIQEGAVQRDGLWSMDCDDASGALEMQPKWAFSELWKKLYGPEFWDANPDVLVLTFSVKFCNIDKLDN